MKRLLAIAAIGVALAGCDQLNALFGGKEVIKGPFAIFDAAACQVERPEHVADLHTTYDGMVWGVAHEAFRKNYSQYEPGMTSEQAKACFAKVDRFDKP